jgi:hypothetical protein
MSRTHHEQVELRERAEAFAYPLALEIEHALRICGVDMLNEALKESGVQLVVKPLPLRPLTPAPEAPTPF